MSQKTHAHADGRGTQVKQRLYEASTLFTKRLKKATRPNSPGVSQQRELYSATASKPTEYVQDS